jgi:tetratricopeptide (TPR) repeat protein
MKPTALLLVVLMSPTLGLSQHEHASGPDAGKTVLTPGLGNVHHKVSTANSEAQAFFDQGLAFIWAFNHDEAARSFKQAAELDPQLAVANWGVALAIGPNYNMDVDPERERSAYQAIQRARQLESGATAGERAYIEALSARFTSDPKANLKMLAVNYKNAMGDVVKSFPDDLDAATLYAESMMDLRPWHLWNDEGQPADGTLEIIRVLESVLARDANHIGANHFYIHAVEASPHPERALQSAERLRTLAPSAGHLVHMPAHIYMRTGDYASAVASNQQGASADQSYIKSGGGGMYALMYYSHNLHFLAIAACMEGNYSEASRAVDELDDNVQPHLRGSPVADLFMATRPLVLVRFRRWDEILKLPQIDKSVAPFTDVFTHFARGMAYAATNRLRDSRAERKAFLKAAKALSPFVPWGFNSAQTLCQIAGDVLSARIAVAERDTAAAARLLTTAVELEDKLAYDEPPDWYVPVRESLGGVLYLNGKYSEAEAVFRADLDRHPRSGRSLYGLSQALRAQQKLAEAGDVEKQFNAAWKNSDVKITMSDL